MDQLTDLESRLVERYNLSELGSADTGISGVRLFYQEHAISRCPLVYHSGIFIILSGQKVAHLGERQYVYGSGRYLALGLPLAMECETIASAEAPLFAIYLAVDPLVVRNVASAMEMDLAPPEMRHPAVASAPFDGEFAEAAHRLMRQLCSDRDAAILGDSTAREIIYRAICGPAGGALKGLLNHDGRTARVANVMQTLQERFAERISVDDMAKMAGMSASAFYRAFREVTNDTPLQYLKKVRLTQATSLIVHRGYRVGMAATAVGYESAAQFSRDFKGHFGVNAADAKELGYAFVRRQLPSAAPEGVAS